MENLFISFFVQHYFSVFMSLPYFAALALFGVLLVLRRAALFGMALSQAAQVSFILGVGWHFAGHEDTFSFINRTENIVQDLYHLDLYVFPLTFLLLVPFLILARKPLRSLESGLILTLILFINLLPIANRFVGGTERTLLSVYFSDILYTPPDVFGHYLPYVIFTVLCLLFFQRVFVIAGYDPVQAKLNGIKPTQANLIFYFLAGMAIAAAVRVVGIYLTMTALVAPAMGALLLGNSLWSVFLLSSLLAIMSAIVGFSFAFMLPDYPSEPLIVVAFAFLTAILWLARKFWRQFHLRISIDKPRQKKAASTS